MAAVKRRVACLAFLLVVGIQILAAGDDAYWIKIGHSFLGLACGLLLIVFHVPEAGVQREVSWSCRIGGCALLGLLDLYAAFYPWHLIPTVGRLTTADFPKRWVNGAQLILLAGLFMVCVIKKHPPSMCAHDAKWCVFGIWLTTMGFQLFEVAKATNDGHFKDFALCLSLGLESVVLGWTVASFQCRMSALRVSHSAVPCFSRIWVYIMSGALISNAAFNALRRGFDSKVSKVGNALFLVVFLCIWATYVVKISSCLVTGLHILLMEARRVRGLPRQQTMWAARVLRMELVICIVLGVTTFFAWSAVLCIRILEVADQDAYDIIKRDFWLYCGVFRRCDLIINAIGLALLSGILWQGSPPGIDQEDKDFDRESKLRGLTSMSDFLQLDEKTLYNAKVEQLASRGIRLSALLEFWAELLEGEIMPSFDPRRSRTNDVVRQAIIPKSRIGSGGLALATLWAEDEVVPLTMVTHNWSNTFAHLIAAIVADALDRDTYSSIAKQLTTKKGLHSVMFNLKAQDKLDATYWICAFSVNQHASICDGFGPEPQENTHAWKVWDRTRHDSVSLERFPVCSCEEEKVRSYKDPTCELNKFDDMMAFRKENTSGFGQLIVIDENFDVLRRAWCVAEMVEGNALSAEGDYTMRVNVFSENAVDVNYDKLALLDVRQCEATSEADKKFILTKIAKPEAFNLKLQHMVFSSQGIFSKWVDGKERSRQVGRIWQRCASIVIESNQEAISQGLLGRPHFRKMFSRLVADSDDSDPEQI